MDNCVLQHQLVESWTRIEHWHVCSFKDYTDIDIRLYLKRYLWQQWELGGEKGTD